MSKIVYLFGAGASCDALPLVSEIPERINGFIKYLESKRNLFKGDGPIAFREARAPESPEYYLNHLIKDLHWLSQVSDYHASVDTFAKKLFLINKNEDLERIKITLSIFFIYEQWNNLPDKRYDTFFASILNKPSELPTHINILTWNYDFQIEQTYSFYSNPKNSLEENQKLLNVFSWVSKHPQIDKLRDDFFVIKLNGSAQFPFEMRSLCDCNNSLYNIPEETILRRIINYYALSRFLCSDETQRSYISFAWDHLHSEDAFIDNVCSLLSLTEVLIIIGYSFPFFNRQVDRRIIKAMSKLDKVYFQSKEPKAIKQRFLSILPDFADKNMIELNDTHQFHLPDEL